MRRIMRSQFYQLAVDKAIFLILLIFIAFDVSSMVKVFYDYIKAGEFQSGGIFFTQCFSSDMLSAMLITALIMAKDQGDKTINYDILTGHGRSTVFFGRFFTALIICEGFSLIRFGLVPAVYTIFNGWGENLSVKGALTRELLMILTVFRYCAETALFSVIFKHKGVTYFMPLAVMFFGDAIASEISFSSNEAVAIRRFLPYLNILSMYQGIELSHYENYNLKGSDGSSIVRFSDYPENMGMIVIMSLGVGAVLLFTAYRIFRRKDLE